MEESSPYSPGNHLAEYGDPEDDSQPWYKLWTKKESEEFLFASGSLKYWLIVSREELIGVDGKKKYSVSDSLITVTSSSDNDQPYQGYYLHHLPSSSIYDCFSKNAKHWIIPRAEGMDVFIRK